MLHGLIRSACAAVLLFACSIHADIVRYTYTGIVNAPGSPFLGGAFELRAQFDLGVAPTLILDLPDEKRYTMPALSHWFKITGAPVGNGTYTANAPVLFGAQNELPPSTDLDSLTFNGVFNTTIGDVSLKMITFFLNPSVMANVATAPPVFNPSDAFLILLEHSVNGTEYNLGSEAVEVEVFPDGTKLPEVSSLAMCAAGVALVGFVVRRLRRVRPIA
jgi:hypothetical protein